MLRLGYVIGPGFQVMAFGALSVFEFANLAAATSFYDVHVLSEMGSSVRSSLGLAIETEPFDAQSLRYDYRRRQHGLGRGVTPTHRLLCKGLLRSLVGSHPSARAPSCLRKPAFLMVAARPRIGRMRARSRSSTLW